MSSPTLLLLDPSKTFTIKTDASDYVIGVVFFQGGHTISFESKNLDATQSWYSVQEKEFFAVIHAHKTWRYDLYGNQFVVTNISSIIEDFF